jgi:hypothetical protein
MKIKELLQCTHARIVLYDRWLVITGDSYCVYERKPYSRKSKIIYEGESESLATAALYLEEF